MQILFRNLCKQFTCVECFTNSRFCSHLTDKLHFYACVCAQSRPSLCNPMDCSPPGSSVHGISQAGILERFASFSSSYISMWAIKRHLNICYYVCFKGSTLVWTFIFLTQKSVYYCYQEEEHSIRLEICSSLGNRFVAWVRNWYMMLSLVTPIALYPWATFVCLTAKY